MWVIVDVNGRALTQKIVPKMALLTPVIDLTTGIMTVTAHNTAESISIPIFESGDCNSTISSSGTTMAAQQVTVCGTKRPGAVSSQHEVNAFFSSILELPCTLVRVAQPARDHDPDHYHSDSGAGAGGGGGVSSGTVQPPSISFANDAQFLMISMESVRYLQQVCQHALNRCTECSSM